MGIKALRRACVEMLDAHNREDWDAAEIVGSPADYWLGDRRVSVVTVNAGLLFILFSSEGIGTDYERHTLNELGRAFAETGKLPDFQAIAPGCGDGVGS